MTPVATVLKTDVLGTDVQWGKRESRLVLIAVHIPFLLVAPVATVAGFEDPSQQAWLVALLALAIASLQLHHSFAAARGMTPSSWPFTLTALAALASVPLPWFGIDWASMEWMLAASLAMLLGGRLRWLAAVPVLSIALWAAFGDFVAAVTRATTTDTLTVSTHLFLLAYWIVGLSGGAICIYGAARLVRAVDELFATRSDLADSSIGLERLRLSRDLHDLLGQSLSAVSLKGDLAVALLQGDAQGAAEAEIRALTEIAREALRDMRQVVLGDHPVSLRAELRRAAALLAEARIHAEVDLEMDTLSSQIDELFGWTTREGVTNMLRHSRAASCSIRTGRTDGVAWLEIINDGAQSTSGDGTGIFGIAARARAVSGSVTAEYLSGGRFRLRVEVPEVL
jgi:two-component system sensor histidine kinase DesK